MGKHVITNLKRTQLYESHLELNARMVEFGGWQMPVQYSGVVAEHTNVRTKVGIFDVSHMGQLSVRGKQAASCLNYLLSNDVTKLTAGRAHYSVLLTEEGTPVDDVIVYKIGEEDFLVCVNASNIEKDFNWMTTHNKFEASILNESSDYALIAVQGPNATELCQAFLGSSLEHLQNFSHEKLEQTSTGIKLSGFIARTGYTGENGYELFIASSQSKLVWDSLLEEGIKFGVLPIGLGARDSLRLEAALCLYGHELREDIDILSAGLAWVTKFDKADFIGMDALNGIRQTGPKYKLVGIELIEPGIARENTKVLDLAGKEIGFVTSGTKTPTIGKSIALAYVQSSSFVNLELGKLEQVVSCVVRDKPIRAKIVPIPFYKRAK